MCNLLLPEVIRDLELVRHGYDVRPLDPQYFVPFPDGRYMISYLDGAKTKEQLRKFSGKDAAAYDVYWSMWDRIRQYSAEIRVGRDEHAVFATRELEDFLIGRCLHPTFPDMQSFVTRFAEFSGDRGREDVIY